MFFFLDLLQESPEGQRMLEFRRSLPAYKEKEALLEAISRNQVLLFLLLLFLFKYYFFFGIS